MRTFAGLMLGVALLAAAIAGTSYYMSGGSPTSPAAAQGGPPGAMAMPVEAVPVRVDTVYRTVTAVGNLLSSESVILRPEVSGRIVAIEFTEGQPVKKGDVLVRLDASVGEATVAEAEASLTLSRADAKRAEELYRQGAGSARSLDEARSRLQADQALVGLARARLDKLTLSAPFDGYLGLRRVSVGDYVSEGQDIVNIEAIDTLKVDFRIPELYLRSVAVGQELSIAVDALAGTTFPGTVYAIDPLIDVNGRSIVIRARVDNADLRLRPGLFARVTLTLASTENAILVPEESVVTFGSDPFVFRVVEGKATLTKVELGQRRNGEVEIISGLSPEDTVVTAGQIKLQDGAPVAVVAANPGS